MYQHCDSRYVFSQYVCMGEQFHYYVWIQNVMTDISRKVSLDILNQTIWAISGENNGFFFLLTILLRNFYLIINLEKLLNMLSCNIT